jgi:heme A synthase
LSRAQRLALALSTLLSAASGLAWAGMRYLLERSDPFSAYRHPLEPWADRAHVLVAPLVVFAVGWIFDEHVLARLRRAGPRRASGWALLALFAAMVASGTLLPLASEPAWRAALAWSHGVAGVLWTAVFAAHAWTGHRRARAERAAHSPPAAGAGG